MGVLVVGSGTRCRRGLQEDYSSGDVPILLDSVECHCNIANIG
jgi:hypothetical protein